MYIFNPLEQFEVYPVFANITNLSLFLIINLFVLVFFVRYNGEEQVIIGRTNLVKESLTATIIEAVKEQLGEHKYYPLLFSLFIFILISNILGMVPYSFTPTSHLIVTIGLSFPIMVGVTIIGVQKYRGQFFALFLPAGTPTWLIPLLTVIELISYVARAFSLGIRLFANIVAGHSLLHILAGFTYQFTLSNAFFLFKFIPVAIIAVFVGLEVAIAFLQAYVFVVLTASYLKDVA